MSTTTANGGKEPRRPPGTAPARRHRAGGAGLGQDASPEGRRRAAAVLEVLAGVRTPGQAAEALGVSLPRYFQLEARALAALVAGCEPRPRGPGRSADQEVTALRREQERLQRELSRQQTLVRLAQRTLGLAPPKGPGNPPAGQRPRKRRGRRPAARALRVAEALRRRGDEAASPEAAGAAGAPDNQPEG